MNMNMMMMEDRVAIAMIPTPGMGHLIPLTELARRLVHSHNNLSITFLIPTSDDSPPSHSQLALLNSLPNSISHTFLPPVHVSDLPQQNTPIETQFLLILTRSIPALRDSLQLFQSSNSTRLVALVVDIFGYPLFDSAKQFGILPYCFFLTSALGLCLAFKLTQLDQTYTCEYRDLPQPIQICPGSVPIHGSDLLDPIQDRKAPVYKQFLDMVQTCHHAAGFFVNTFHDLEPAALTHLKENHMNIPPVYPIGPLIRTADGNGSNSSNRNGCLRWLDEQPHGSVLYVSFGSGGTLSHEQLTELAFGLELSGVRFLWVVKSPHNTAANAAYFTPDTPTEIEPLGYLPQGFLERTNRLGSAVPYWAPQVQVLSHDATGGFLSHCGWNSIMESLVHGKPFIAWPLFAEQRFNAVVLAQDLKVAFRVKPNEKGLVGREEIAKLVTSLIQGEDGKVLRERMMDLKHKAEHNYGSASKSISQVAQVWMNRNTSQVSLSTRAAPAPAPAPAST